MKAPASYPRRKGLLSRAYESGMKFISGPTGKSIFNKATAILGKVTGLGDYTVKKNSFLTDNGPPSFGESDVVITKREYLGDVQGSSNFTITSYPLNVGMSQTFPWLSQIAGSFEQYKFEGLLFEFRSTSANALNSTNTALGTVVMSTNYDALDSAFQNKQQMEAYQYTTVNKPSDSCLHMVECDPKRNTLSEMYIRSGSIPSSADLRFYDLGNFQFATAGMQAAAVIGELWVTYKVRLIRKKLSTPTGDSLPFGLALTAPSTTNFFTGALISNLSNLNGLYIDPVVQGIYWKDAGRFLVTATVSSNSAFTIGTEFSPGYPVVPVTILESKYFNTPAGLVTRFTTNGAATSALTTSICIEKHFGMGGVVIAALGTAAAACLANITIVQIPSTPTDEEDEEKKTTSDAMIREMEVGLRVREKRHLAQIKDQEERLALLEKAVSNMAMNDDDVKSDYISVDQLSERRNVTPMTMMYRR